MTESIQCIMAVGEVRKDGGKHHVKPNLDQVIGNS